MSYGMEHDSVLDCNVRVHYTRLIEMPLQYQHLITCKSIWDLELLSYINNRVDDCVSVSGSSRTLYDLGLL